MLPTLEQRALSRSALSRLRRSIIGLDIWFAAGVGGLAFLLTYDRGGFALSARAATAIVACWALLLGVGLGVWPRSRVPRTAWVVAGLLAAFALWTFASIWWAKSAENAFIEFNRVTMYLAIFLIAVFAGTRSNIRRWADGLAAAVAAIATVALVSRCFPSTFSLQGFPTFLPGVVTRLSFPIGYWNGLGILVGFAYPLWLGLALRARRWWTRLLALVPFPTFAVVIYLTSSRGGVVAAWVGALVFLATTTRRWTAVGALAAAAAGSAAAIAVLLPRHELVDGPLRTHQAAVQGHQALLLILAISAGTGVLYAGAHRLAGGLSPSPALGRMLLGAIALGLVATAFASDPTERFETFKSLPETRHFGDSGFVRSHLLSGSGSGRWQFWTAALHEWESAPVVGRGAGSYQAWWAEHASFSYFVRNAHSLYLEVLGELGVVGLLLLGGAFAYGGVVAATNTVRGVGDERVVTASLLGVVAAFLVGAGIEWIWQLTALGAIGLVCLGLLIGPAGSAVELRPIRAGQGLRSPRLPRFALGATVLVVGWLAMCAQAIPWLTELQIKASAAAVGRNDGISALRHALDAKDLQSWAASPYLQLALVQEQRQDLAAARKWIGEAIERNEIDWRLWLVAARIETKEGDLAAARRSLQRAEALNPRSPLFAGNGS
jgi:O-Antigen ligase